MFRLINFCAQAAEIVHVASLPCARNGRAWSFWQKTLYRFSTLCFSVQEVLKLTPGGSRDAKLGASGGSNGSPKVSSRIPLRRFFLQNSSYRTRHLGFLLEESFFRLPTPGFLFQDSSTKMSPQGFLLWDSFCSIPLPGFLLQDSSPKILPLGFLVQDAFSRMSFSWIPIQDFFSMIPYP